MTHHLWLALCLVLVIEGMLPFLAPTLWQRGVVDLARMSPRSIRIMGLVSMLLGTGLLYLLKG